MVVNVLTSSQKYLFFVETNTAGYCHFRTSPAVFVKTKKQIFLTKTRDIYSHFWGGGVFTRYYQLDIVPRSPQICFLSLQTRLEMSWLLRKSRLEAAKRSRQKHLVLSSRARLLDQIYQFFLSPSTQAPSQTAAAGSSSLLFHHFFPSLLRNVCIAE